MAPTPPNQSAGQSQAQPLTQDQRVTNGLRWFNTVCAAISLAMITWVAQQFMQTRDNQLRLGIIVSGLEQKVTELGRDNDQQDAKIERYFERTQMHGIAITEMQRRMGLR